MEVASLDICPINKLTDDLLIKILWHTVPVVNESPRGKSWASLDPDSGLISVDQGESVSFGPHEPPSTPIPPPPPPSADVALCLFNASICKRWRELAKEYVSTLAVGKNSIVTKADISAVVSAFPNVTHLHLNDGSVDSLDDEFLSHLGASCPKLKALHLGWRMSRVPPYKRDGEHPITTDGLDTLFKKCPHLEQLSIFRTPKPADLPKSFFQLKHLRTLLLTDAKALADPGFRKLSSLTTLYIAFPWSYLHLTHLAHLPQLTHISIFGKFQNVPGSSPPCIALPACLESLNFIESCPRFNLSSPLRLQQLLISNCSQLELLPDRIGELLPCLRKLIIRGCDALTRLPEDFSSLSRLETCFLSGDRLLSSLPRNLGRLSGLKVLVLEEVSALPESFSHLSSLQGLIILYSCIRTLPAHFYHLTALKALTLWSVRKLVLPDDFGRLPNLEFFRLDDYEQDVLPPSFSQLSSLAVLVFDYCTFKELPEGMEALQNLQSVEFLGCEFMKAIPESFTTLTRLHTLKFDDQTPWNDWEAELSSVPRRLDNLKRLKDLCLSCCKNLMRLPEALPESLEVLNLDINKRNTPLPDFSLLPNLRDLTLWLPKPGTGRALDSSSLPHLQHLCLHLGYETRELPFALAFPQLRSLEIRSSVRRLPGNFGSLLPQLRKLTLVEEFEKLEELPASLSELRNLVSLNIRGKFTSLPAGLSSLPRLRVCHVEGRGVLLQLPATPSSSSPSSRGAGAGRGAGADRGAGAEP